MKIKSIRLTTDEVRATLDGRKTVTRRVVKPQPVYSEKSGFNWKGRAFGTDLPPTVNGAAYNFRCAAPYRPGDILYVRETWQVQSARRFDSDVRIMFKAGGPLSTIQFPGRNSQATSRDEYDSFTYKWMQGDGWHPSIHMPREAARIFLRVTDVRVERLQEITAESAIAEGVVGAIPPSIRHKEKQSKWCSGFCSECVHFDLEAGLAKDNCPGDYEAQKPHNGTSVGCTFEFDLKPDTAYEPPIFQFQQLWDKAALKSKNCIFWSQNPWVWVIEFEHCDKPKEG